MSRFEYRLIVALLFGIFASVTNNDFLAVILSLAGLCYAVAAMFTIKESPHAHE